MFSFTTNASRQSSPHSSSHSSPRSLPQSLRRSLQRSFPRSLRLSILKFLKSDNALTLACFTAGLSTLTKKEIFDAPVFSIMCVTMGAAFNSSLLHFVTPEELKPAVTTSIFGLSVVNFANRICTKTEDNSCNHIESNADILSYESKSTLSTDDIINNESYRISFSAHKYLENHGHLITFGEKLNINNIIQAITSIGGNTFSIPMIEKILNNFNCDISNLQGVHIHDNMNGLVMIMSRDSTVNTNPIMNIRVN